MNEHGITEPGDRMVTKAEMYRDKDTQSDFPRNANVMLLQQHAFPYIYEEKDVLLAIDSSQLIRHSLERYIAFVENGTGVSYDELEEWVLSASVNELFRFLIELFETKEQEEFDWIDWTGYRVCVGDTPDGPIFFFELFAQHKSSKLQVYSGSTNAMPNVNDWNN